MNLGQKLILILIGSLSKTTDCAYGSKLSILLQRVLQRVYRGRKTPSITPRHSRKHHKVDKGGFSTIKASDFEII